MLIALGLAGLSGVAVAQNLSAQQSRCLGQDPSASRDVRIADCTALIGAAAATPEAVAVYKAARAAALAQSERFDEAIADATEAIRLRPQLHMGYVIRGEIRGLRGDYRGAFEDYTEAIRLYPDSPDMAEWLNRRGYLSGQLGEHEVALLDYSALIGLNARDAEAWGNRGWSYHALGQSGVALGDFSRAIELNPNEPSYWHGRCRARLAISENALQDCDEFLRLDANNPYAFASRGQAHLKDRSWSAAESDFTRALELSPGYGSALFGRAIARAAMGQGELAETDKNEALRLAPDTAEGYAAMNLKYVPVQ